VAFIQALPVIEWMIVLYATLTPGGHKSFVGHGPESVVPGALRACSGGRGQMVLWWVLNRHGLPELPEGTLARQHSLFCS